MPTTKAGSRNYVFLALLFLPIIFGAGCNKDKGGKELFQVEYLYTFEMAGGLLPQLSHMYRFENKPIDINGVLDKKSLSKVRSASVITAELFNMENDGGLREIRQLECFIYPTHEDNEYYDIAYTVELPRVKRDHIQLFSSGDEIKDLYEHAFMDVALRVWLWEITPRSRKMQFRILVGFYE